MLIAQTVKLAQVWLDLKAYELCRTARVHN